jgi:sugar phosphate isomerase/epimerase
VEHLRTIVLGVAPLSALDMAPADYIRAAAMAGFKAVGLRIQPVSPSDVRFPRNPASAVFRGIADALKETDVEAVDAEVFSLGPDSVREHWLGVLEIASRLGIRFLNVVGDHPDADRLADLLSKLAIDARDHGIMPVLEPIAYRSLNSYPAAVALAKHAGCAVELDILHFIRTGATTDLVARDPGLFPVMQLCDAPSELAEHGPALAALAGGTDVHSLMVAESRLLRLPPGSGSAPIGELLAMLPPDTILSVEVPNVQLRGNLSPAQYLAFLYSATRNFLNAVADRYSGGS